MDKEKTLALIYAGWSVETPIEELLELREQLDEIDMKPLTLEQTEDLFAHMLALDQELKDRDRRVLEKYASGRGVDERKDGFHKEILGTLQS